MAEKKELSTGVRLGIALVISFLIMFIFKMFIESNEKVIPKTTTQTSSQVQSQALQSSISVKETQKSQTLDKKSKKFKEEPNEIKEEKIVKKETENYILEFSSKGGTLKRIQLKKYLHEGGKYIDITPNIDALNKPLLYHLENIVISMDYDISEKDGNIIFSQNTKDFNIEKKYIFTKDQYDITLEVSVQNKTNNLIQSKESLSWGKGLGPFLVKEKRTSYDEEVITSYYDIQKKSEQTVDRKSETKNVTTDWVGITNRYFFLALIPDKPGGYEVKIQSENQFEEKIELANTISLRPLETYKSVYKVYLGTKDDRILKPYQRNLESVTERSWAPIALISQGIKFLTFFINDFVHNFGITIVLLSLLFKVVLNPLTKKSMESARKMQDLQPQTEALKAKYKDPKELNAKIWEVYRANKINPLGGCIPLVLQMPFFFALYAVLPYMIELKNVDFLWITDLSSPDTVGYIEMFKNTWLLPYRVNILPVLLAVFSFIQTRWFSGGTPATGQAKMMAYLMPVMFLFIFWTMPSGLVLYWLMQTLFGIAQQFYINKRPKKKKEEHKPSLIKKLKSKRR